jgi:hypothetical protein
MSPFEFSSIENVNEFIAILGIEKIKESIY